MAKSFVKAALFGAAVISYLGIAPAAALDWSGQISDVELAGANTPPSSAFAISSPFSFAAQRPGVNQPGIRLATLDTGAASITQAMISLSFRLHVSYP